MGKAAGLPLICREGPHRGLGPERSGRSHSDERLCVCGGLGETQTDQGFKGWGWPRSCPPGERLRLGEKVGAGSEGNVGVGGLRGGASGLLADLTGLLGRILRWVTG